MTARELPRDWQWRWLPDGRVAALEQLADGWHVIVERSTLAIVASKADALKLLAEQDTSKRR